MNEREGSPDYSRIDELVQAFQKRLEGIDAALASVHKNIAERQGQATDQRIDEELKAALLNLETERTSIAAELESLRQESDKIRRGLESFDSDIKH